MLRHIVSKLFGKGEPKKIKIHKPKSLEDIVYDYRSEIDALKENVDIHKLVSEINSMACKLSFLKDRISDLNREISNGGGNFSEISACWNKLRDFKLRCTKLNVLRALLRGRNHLSTYTDLDKFGINSLEEDDLWDWVEGELEEFQLI